MSDIHARIEGHVGRITLNREKALNALTLDMVHAMTDALVAWRSNAGVAAIVVDGAGDRAFCAGGDIVMLHASGQSADGQAQRFWRDEYVLNALIADYPKPYVALMDGITMGGGVGVSVHGDFRVATERTMLAMPETGIGFFPDVGATYVLPRLPDAIGIWMGLTGSRLSGADCLAVGLATHYVEAARIPALLEALSAAELDGQGGAVEATLAAFETTPPDPEIAQQCADIQRHFSLARVSEIRDSLRADGSLWALKQLEVLAGKSPTALRVTMEGFRRGRALSLHEALQAEFVMSLAFLKGHDFYEGVRAAVIDKDRNPQWSPARPEDVPDEALEPYFQHIPTIPLPFRS
jgi:enoyl-CoA hydratase